MKVEQYRLVRSPHGWRIQATFGLLNVEWLHSGTAYKTQVEARKAAKEHAARNGDTSPIILT